MSTVKNLLGIPVRGADCKLRKTKKHGLHRVHPVDAFRSCLEEKKHMCLKCGITWFYE